MQTEYNSREIQLIDEWRINALYQGRAFQTWFRGVKRLLYKPYLRREKVVRVYVFVWMHYHGRERCIGNYKFRIIIDT